MIAAHADISSDGAVKAAPGSLMAVLLTAGTGTAANLVLYDNDDAASGTVLANMRAPAGESISWTPSRPYAFATGCYADIDGTGANATIVYL